MDRPNKPRRRNPRRETPPHLSGEERLSRFLAFVLRHHPEEAGLTLDKRGSANLDDLVEAVRKRPGFPAVTRKQIERLVSAQSPPRFEIQGDRIRALYGHSFPQPIHHDPGDPPPTLFHGTTPEAAEQILADGLEAGTRQYVHLSTDMPAAREVGGRHSPHPAILQVDTVSARKAGVRFYPANPVVWLSDAIPPECITRSE